MDEAQLRRLAELAREAERLARLVERTIKANADTPPPPQDR